MAENTSNKKKSVVLVVDDEPKNLRLLEALIVPHDYKVIKAHDGLEALERIKKEVPHVILLDVMMPGMDGFEACKLLKSNALSTMEKEKVLRSISGNGLYRTVDITDLLSNVKMIVD